MLRHLHGLSVGRAGVRPADQARALSPAVAIGSAPTVQVLQRSDRPVERPEDARWTLTREFNHTTLTARPRLGPWLGGVAILTFFVLFWNGIVSVFILELIKDFQWFLFCFLLPFEVVGLVMIGVWLASVLAPFMRSQYAFNPGEIATRTTVFGIGRTRHKRLERLDRIEMRRSRKRTGPLKSSSGEAGANDRPFALALVDASGKDLVEIDGLTEAEARWMADELFNDFRNWHIRVG